MPFTPYVPKKYHIVMVLPDLHIPYHDEAALECVKRAHKAIKPKRTVILGDWLDAEPFKRFESKSLLEKKAHDFKKDEIDPCNTLLDELAQNTKELIYIEGNHEARIEKIAAAESSHPSLKAVHSLISPRTLLSNGRSNFIWVPYNEKLSHYKIAPDLWALHGWSHSKHVAETHINYLTSVSCIFGHVHRQQAAVRRNKVTNKIIKAWTPGCLCTLQPLWDTQSPTDWVHGFDIIYVRNDGTGWFNYTITIENGTCVLPGGKLIEAA